MTLRGSRESKDSLLPRSFFGGAPGGGPAEDEVHRLLAVVVGCEELGRRRDRSGLTRASCRLRVAVKGAAIGALKLPDRVVGREGSLSRECLLPWAPKRGDLLVLDPAESRRFLAPRGTGSLRPGGEARARLLMADVDGDGWREDVFVNAFVAGAVQPHRGARLLSLVGRDGRDRLSQPCVHIMAGQYVLLGGAEEFLHEAGMPGDVWKAAFTRRAESGAAVTYERRLKAPEGVTLSKAVSVEPGFPGILELVTLSYAARPAADGNDADPGGAGAAKDTTDVTPGIRMTTPVLGAAGSLNVFEIPSRGELVKVRYHRPPHGRRWRWRDWRDEFFGIGPGFLVSRNEREGNAMAVLFRARGAVVNVRSDFEGPEIVLRGPRATLRKGRAARFGVAFVAADALAASATSLLLVTLGRSGKAAVPVAITLRTSKKVARPRAVVAGRRGGRRAVPLRRLEIPGAGAVYTAVLSVRASSFPMRCSVRVPGEELACVAEE